MVKNPPHDAGDIRTTGVVLGPGRPPEEGMAAHSNVLAWRIPWTEEPGGYSPQGHTKLDTTEAS